MLGFCSTLHRRGDVIPFPARKARLALDPPAFDKIRWDRLVTSAHALQQLHEENDKGLKDEVAAMLRETGAASVERMMERNRADISTLRALLGMMIETDHRIGTAADSILREWGA